MFNLLRYIISRKARQDVRDSIASDANIQKRETTVVLKIAKLCGHRIEITDHLVYYYYPSGPYTHLDRNYPFTGGTTNTGLQNFASLLSKLEIVGFPDWLVGASLEEAELRLAIIDI